jgi:ubiquinone/menaquinone biosynthesis C-methylase UbiE
MTPPRRRNSDVLLETLELAGKRVIDAGCGDGTLARLMAAKGAASVTGIETEPRQLAKAKAAGDTPGVDFLHASAAAMPFANGQADIVVFFNSLHHIPPDLMDQALAEAARVIGRNGQIYVSEPLPEGSYFDLIKPVDDETEVRRLAYEAILRAAAGKLQMAHEFVYVHPIAHKSFEAFRERIASANPEREAIMIRQDAALRASFAKLSKPVEGAFGFDQPMRVNVLTKR